MSATISTLTSHALASVRQLDSSLDERAARRLLDVHLCPEHFPMPIHSLAAERSLVDFCKGSGPIGEASALLSFEDTRGIKGIVRVLARTHTNRQGVGDVTRGAQWKALSPRVVGIFDGVADEAGLRAWTDHRCLIDAWLELASRHRSTDTPGDLRFDDGDVSSLQALRQLSANEARRLNVADVPGLTRRGWGRVVLGLHTGLVYLDQRFDLDPARVWAAVDAAQTARAVADLSADAMAQVTEFGPALAPSFFADLGSEQFVKPDVHVVDVATAAMGSLGSLSPASSVAMVRQLAADVGWSPRQVDKLMYLACSGKYYLAGLKPRKPDADARKRELIARLRSIPATQRPRVQD